MKTPPDFSGGFVFGLALVYLFEMKKFFEKYQPRHIFLGALGVAAIVTWSAVFHFDGGRLTVAFLDVGQGDAIFIETPEGNQVLIDGGPNKKVLSELSRVMPFYDRSIDALVLTHPQLDHLGGLVEVLRRYDADFVFEPGTKHSIAEFELWENLLEEKGVARILAKRGQIIRLSPDIYFEILSPEPGAFENKVADLNEVVVAGRLVYGETEFLFTGDLTKFGEIKILASGSEIQSDVLKVAHHGSKNSSVEKFLAAVSPKIAVIMSGKNNRYGHPNAETLLKLEKIGAQIFRTDTSGTIILQSDGKNVFVK